MTRWIVWPGVDCKSCGEPFRLDKLSLGNLFLKKLPIPFKAACSHCTRVAQYTKADIQPFLKDRKSTSA
jgi:hypothetical protein